MSLRPKTERGPMYKQTIRLENPDGSHCCWLAPKEMERRIRGGTVRKVSEKGKPVKYRVIAFPGPSDSASTRFVQITAEEAQRIAALTEKDLRNLAGAALAPVADKSIAHRLKQVQRWIGHGLIPLDDMTAPIAEAVIL